MLNLSIAGGAKDSELNQPRQDVRFAAEYERVRRQEYELVSRMLEVLPRADGVSEEQMNQLRDALFHADTPYLMVFLGPFSSGKSSIINALLGRPDVLPVGITPTTERITMLRHGDTQRTARSGDFDTVFFPSELLRRVSFVDTPGLESVFAEHEAVTRRFLHRADAVILVMLATQAMTAANLEYLRLLKEYGKTVIVAINQVDLLSPEEAERVRAYVAEQSRELLHTEPRIWLLSSRNGIEARLPDGTVDPELWKASGLEQLETFIDGELGDAERMRQKLQTPLQIAQSVHQAAMHSVHSGQAAIDRFQSIQHNVDMQIAGFRREDERAAAEVAAEVRARFDDAAGRGASAIQSVFGVGHVPGALLSGLAELTGLRRALGGKSPIERAWESARVTEPLQELRSIAERLAPRLEARHMQDMDDLVAYAQREIDGLPPEIGGKLIGRVEPSTQYERSQSTKVRSTLDDQVTALTATLQKDVVASVSSANVFFAAYEVMMAVIFIFLMLAQPASAAEPLLWAYLMVAVVVLALAGVGGWIVRGLAMAQSFRRRLDREAEAYLEVFNKAARAQIDYGVELRRSAIHPLTRLIEAQTTTMKSQLEALQSIGQQILAAETALTRLN